MRSNPFARARKRRYFTTFTLVPSKSSTIFEIGNNLSWHTLARIRRARNNLYFVLRAQNVRGVY